MSTGHEYGYEEESSVTVINLTFLHELSKVILLSPTLSAKTFTLFCHHSSANHPVKYAALIHYSACYSFRCSEAQ